MYFIFDLIFFSSVCDKGLTDCELFKKIVTLLKGIEFYDMIRFVCLECVCFLKILAFKSLSLSFRENEKHMERYFCSDNTIDYIF